MRIDSPVNFTVTVHSNIPGRFVSPGPTRTKLSGGFQLRSCRQRKSFISANLRVLGNQTITATDSVNNLLSGSAVISMVPAAVTRFSVTTEAAAMSCVRITVTVTALDHLGNISTNYLGTVHFTTPDANANVPGDYIFFPRNNGTAQFSATLRTVGNQTITVADT
jgi:adhesin/invasin